MCFALLSTFKCRINWVYLFIIKIHWIGNLFIINILGKYTRSMSCIENVTFLFFHLILAPKLNFVLISNWRWNTVKPKLSIQENLIGNYFFDTTTLSYDQTMVYYYANLPASTPFNALTNINFVNLNLLIIWDIVTSFTILMKQSLKCYIFLF